MEHNFKSTEPASPDRSRDLLYQVSLLQGLTFGDYHGSVTIGEVKQHGDAGIGTFDRLNGELILLDGEVYRAAGDGSVEKVSDGETVPFAVSAFLQADETMTLQDIASYDALFKELDLLVEKHGKNRFYVIRIEGRFRKVHVRSVNAQSEPYLRLAKVLEYDQTFFDYEDIEGAMVGLYCPPFMSTLNAVGWHLHFITADKSRGGHVLGLQIDEAQLQLDVIDGFELRLPPNQMFAGFDLTEDQTADIAKVELNR